MSVAGGGGAQAFVVELIVALPDRLPAASNASTERLYVAPHSRPETVYEVEVVVPAVELPSYAVYPATPTLSVEAVHATVTELGVAPVACRLLGVDGAVVSAAGGQALVEVVRVARAE